MQRSDFQDSETSAVLLLGLGSGLAAVSAAATFAAAGHMAVAADLCAPLADHCLLCVAAVGSLLASAGVFLSGVMLLQARQPEHQTTGLRG